MSVKKKMIVEAGSETLESIERRKSIAVNISEMYRLNLEQVENRLLGSSPI